MNNLTTAQAAKELGVSRTSIYRLMDAGKLTVIRLKFRGKALIPRESFERFIKAHTKEATAYGEKPKS